VHLVGSYYTDITRRRSVQTPQTAVWRTVLSLRFISINSADNVLHHLPVYTVLLKTAVESLPTIGTSCWKDLVLVLILTTVFHYLARILAWMYIKVFITGDKLTQTITMLSIKLC